MFRRLGRFLMLAISAVLFVLPFHQSVFAPLAFIAWVPAFIVFSQKDPSEAFVAGYGMGCLFFGLLGYWLTNVSVVGFVAAVLYLALYFGLFAFSIALFLKPTEVRETPMCFIMRKLRVALYFAAFWVALEYVRGWFLTGLPWALAAYTQWRNPAFIQIADCIGAFGVSFLVMLSNAFLGLFALSFTSLSRREPAFATPGLLIRYRLTFLGALLFLFLAVLGYGWSMLSARDSFYKSPAPKARLRISLIQGNIPQDQKWNARIKNIIFEKYKRLTLMSALEQPDLIVWPETSFPGYLEDEPTLAPLLRNTVRQIHTPILVGAPTLGNLERGLQFYNSAVLFAGNGEETARYSKLHLVPFGEYLPAGFGFLRRFFKIGDFSPGPEPTIFSIRSMHQTPAIAARFAAVICYEDIFPGLVRRFRNRGANFLVNITNDAWFGDTSAPYQHAQASVFRAVENRIPIVRATNTGFSCFITAEGRITSSVQDSGREIMVTGHQSDEIILRRGKSIYTRFGDAFMLLVLGLILLSFKDRRIQENYTCI